MFRAGQRAVLVDERGRRHLVVLEPKMLELRGVGAFDGAALLALEPGAEFTIGAQRFRLLRPSLADLLSSLERRAQIMHPKDSAMLLFHADIGPGSTVVEIGAGSGALTIVLLRAVGQSGRVITYERREDFAAVAERNILRAGLEARWELRRQDATGGLEVADADAVVADIPEPWTVVAHAQRALRPGGHFASFVPNTNQVERTVEALRQSGLADVHAREVLERELVVHPGGVRPSFEMLGHTGYLIVARKLASASSSSAPRTSK